MPTKKVFIQINKKELSTRKLPLQTYTVGMVINTVRLEINKVLFKKSNVHWHILKSISK